MHRLRSTILLSSLVGTVVGDLLGPTYPAPSDISSSNSKVKKAYNDLTSAFDKVFQNGQIPSGFEDLKDAGKVTFSTSLFSLYDDGATNMQYHYTATQIKNAKQGTNKVDADSIYRVASVSKLITVFTGLLELTQEQWNTPLSEVFPALAQISNNSANNAIKAIQWDQITPWALANQLSGIPTMGLPQGDLFAQLYFSALTTNASVTSLEAAVGLPPTTLNDYGPCIVPDLSCSRTSFLQTIAADTPVELPWATPGYSDLNFFILGAVISKYTGKPFDQMYEDFVFSRLGMTSSYANAPLSGPAFNDHGVVVPLINGSWWFAKNNPTLPSGGILSTINDLNKFGLGLLNATLLSPVKTREWMKPHTHTQSLTTSIGAPWEITRYISPETGKVTDVYAKLGDSGAYGGIVALIPDYGMGFTLLNAYYETPATLYRGEVALTLINHIVEAIMPALEAQAAEEAVKNFVGTYKCEDGLNSSLVVSFNESGVTSPRTGLSISSWISNGTDMLAADAVPGFGMKPQLQITVSDDLSSQVAFRATMYSTSRTYRTGGYGPYTGFYDSNWDVWTYEGTEYGGQAIRRIVFDLDAQGEATSVRIPALKVTLKKTKVEARYIMDGIGGS